MIFRFLVLFLWPKNDDSYLLSDSSIHFSSRWKSCFVMSFQALLRKRCGFHPTSWHRFIPTGQARVHKRCTYVLFGHWNSTKSFSTCTIHVSQMKYGMNLAGRSISFGFLSPESTLEHSHTPLFRHRELIWNCRAHFLFRRSKKSSLRTSWSRLSGLPIDLKSK